VAALNMCDGCRQGGRYRTSVGFNPFRQQVKRRSDIVLVVAAFVVIAGLLVWVVFPR
jgi:hypothetical protein